MISALRHGMRGKTNPDAPPEVTSSLQLAAVIPPLVAILRISLPVQAEEVKEQVLPPYAIGAGAPIMSKPPTEEITEVGSESAGDPAEQSVEGTQPTDPVG